MERERTSFEQGQSATTVQSQVAGFEQICT